MTRRRGLAASAAAALAAAGRGRGAEPPAGAAMLARKIPRSGEEVPAIGLGTWRTFDVGPSAEERAPRIEVLRRFFAAGGRVIDSSPMYGEAEAVVGDLLAALRPRPPPFLATKVWTRGRTMGETQMRDSLRRFQVERLDLMQVHNLVDWREHLPAMREWKAAGKLRYVGVTHYSESAFDELERILRGEKVDFVQLPYSVATRAAEARLLPAAAETGTAVLVMRPFEEGELFEAVKGKRLPPWAKGIGASAWSEVFLKWILGHPAVTAVIPATANPEHVAENVRAGLGPLPDAALRKRIVRELGY
jgi:aryl-alcohol dehydrogenase-like predicted oxidoreductase